MQYAGTLAEMDESVKETDIIQPMLSDRAQSALDATQATLQKTFGDELLALVLYGDFAGGYQQEEESRLALLAVVSEHIPWSALREAYRPVWQQHAPLLRNAPTITTLAHWHRYGSLNPNFVHTVHHKGHVIVGTLPAMELRYDARFAHADHCLRALVATATVAPDLLHDEARLKALASLRQLIRDLTESPAPDIPAITQLTTLHTILQSQSDALSIQAEDLPRQTETPPELPELLSIYEKVDQLILVLPELNEAQLTSVDWPTVAKRVASDYGSLHLCTPEQLQAISLWLNPTAVMLRHYEHAWGHNFLAALDVKQTDVLQEAARNAARIHLEQMPSAYLAATDDELGKLVHDYQNKLLNIQLQHELFHRLLGLEKSAPDQPLLGRGSPMPERVESTLDHLNWWANHYHTLIQLAAQDTNA